LLSSTVITKNLGNDLNFVLAYKQTNPKPRPTNIHNRVVGNRNAGIDRHNQALELSRLTTTASAINTPHLHFSNIHCRHIAAHPVPGAGGFGIRLSCGLGFFIGTVAMGPGEGEGVIEVVDRGAGVASGLPSDRSPMLGSGRGSCVQY